MNSITLIYPEEFSDGEFISGFYSKRNKKVFVLGKTGTHAEILMQLFPEVVNKETLEDDPSFYKAIEPLLKAKELVRIKKAGDKVFIDTSIVPVSLEERGDMIENFTSGNVIPKFTYPVHDKSITAQFKENSMKFDDLVEQYLQEKKKAADRCKRRADSVYGKKTSAYKSGAIVRCRRGDIWKKK